VYADNPLDNQAVEYVKDAPEGATHAVITIWIYKSGGGSAVTMDNFYCYLQSGNTMADLIPQIVDNLKDGGIDKSLSAEQGKVIGEVLYGKKSAHEIPLYQYQGDIYGWHQCINTTTAYGTTLFFTNNTSENEVSLIKGDVPGDNGFCIRSAYWNNSVSGIRLKCRPNGYNSFITFLKKYPSEIENGSYTLKQLRDGGYLANIHTDNAVISLPPGSDSTWNYDDIKDAVCCCITVRENNTSSIIRSPLYVGIVTENVVYEDITFDKSCRSLFPLNGFVQQMPNTDWSTSDSSTAVCTSAMLVPYYRCKLDFVLPEEITVRLQLGNIVSSTSTSAITPQLKSTYTVGNVANIRFIFQKWDGTSITASEVQSLVDKGEIKVYYANETPNVVEKNIGCETYTKAVMYKHKTASADSFLHNIPVIAHFSDVHGDIVRVKNMLDYCKYLGVDVAINTGDTVCNKAIDGVSSYNELVNNYDFPTLVCIGNHDAWLLNDNTPGNGNTKMYNRYINPNSIQFGYELPNDSDYDDSPTYYYRDFDNQKIRVICLNQYEQGLRDWSVYGRISEKQVNWLIDTLSSTPQDYGVILMYHAREVSTLKDSTYDKFFDDLRTGTVSGLNISGSPITTIIDAFISKVSIDGQYTQLLVNNGSETISYHADFTSLNSGVEFICHMNGHAHADFVTYYNGTTNLQLCLNITTAQSLYGFTHYYKANDGDIPRGGEGACEEAFNIYGLDRENGTVRIARVGANISSSLKVRDCMIIPYK
jgi:hypothetical protein